MPTVVISDDTTGIDFNGVEDARIGAGAPTTNNGSAATIEATAYDVADDNRSVIRFTGLSNIPTDAVVSAVSLILNCTANFTNTVAPNEVQIYRCLRAWVEGQVTWNIFSTGNSWATAGGQGTGDSSGSLSHSEVPADGTGDRTFTSAGMIADVQAWIDGSVANNGWLLKHSGDPSGALLTKVYEFVSSEGADGSRPALSVTYTVPAGGAAAGKKTPARPVNLGQLFSGGVFRSSLKQLNSGLLMPAWV